MTIKDRVTVANGANARLIIKDGMTLDCQKEITVLAGSSFNLYGQTNNAGILYANAESRNREAGIGGGGEGYTDKTITILGVSVDAKGGKYVVGHRLGKRRRYLRHREHQGR